MSKNRYQIDFVFAVGIFSDEFVYSMRDIFGDNIDKWQHPFQSVSTCVFCSCLHDQNPSGKNYEYCLSPVCFRIWLLRFWRNFASWLQISLNGYLNFPSSVRSNSLSLFLISRHFWISKKPTLHPLDPRSTLKSADSFFTAEGLANGCLVNASISNLFFSSCSSISAAITALLWAKILNRFHFKLRTRTVVTCGAVTITYLWAPTSCSLFSSIDQNTSHYLWAIWYGPHHLNRNIVWSILSSITERQTNETQQPTASSAGQSSSNNPNLRRRNSSIHFFRGTLSVSSLPGE